MGYSTQKMLANMSGVKFMAYFYENTRQGNNADI